MIFVKSLLLFDYFWCYIDIIKRYFCSVLLYDSSIAAILKLWYAEGRMVVERIIKNNKY